MKITIVQGPFLPVPPLLGGAIEKVFFPLGLFWASRGHSVTHISRAYKDLPAEEVLGGVHHLRVPSADSTSSGLKNKLLDFQYSLRVLKNLPPADILVTHTFFLPLLARWMDPSRRHGAVFVHVGRFPKGQLGLYSAAARLQFPSTAVAKVAARQVPALEKKFAVIPYPLASLPVPAPRSAIKVPCRLLYVGRVHPEKGLHLLLQALALLPVALQPQLQLRVVGPHEAKMGGGGEEYLSQLKALAQKTSASIIFIGPIFNADALANEYAAGDLFVYPSLADEGETFGVAPLEALSHGTPALVSALECFGDFISSKNGFVFDHRTATPAVTLASALTDALSHAAEWPALSVAAVETAAHFRLEIIGERFIKEFTDILSKERKS